jgi:hypothetical protein
MTMWYLKGDDTTTSQYHWIFSFRKDDQCVSATITMYYSKLDGTITVPWDFSSRMNNFWDETTALVAPVDFFRFFERIIKSAS